MIKKAVIFCGGFATRFLPISKSIPKEMLPLLDKPILQKIVEDLKDAGIEQCLMIIGRNRESVMLHFDKNFELENRLIKTKKFDMLKLTQNPSNLMEIFYKRELEPKGLINSLYEAKGFVNNEPFVLMFGDEVIFTQNENAIQQLLKDFDQNHKTVIAVQEVEWSKVSNYGIIKPDNLDNDLIQVLDMIEKPKLEDAYSNISYIGPAIITPDIFDEMDIFTHKDDIEPTLTDAFIRQAKKGNLFAKKIVGDRYDTGSKLGFLKANIAAALQDNKIKDEIVKYIKDLANDL